MNDVRMNIFIWAVDIFVSKVLGLVINFARGLKLKQTLALCGFPFLYGFYTKDLINLLNY